MALVRAATVRASYRSGVDAIDARVRGFTDDDWGQPACGVWSAADTVRHLLSVVGWYHAWLDRAVEGQASIPFPVEDMDEHTEAALAEVGAIDPDQAGRSFVDRAHRYLDRIDDETWNRPYGYPRGVVTTGLHAGIAAVEWHVHAWDLSPDGDRHRPDDPAGLLLGAAACNAAAAGAVSGRLLRLLAPVAARRDPWPELLRRTGRDPGPT